MSASKIIIDATGTKSLFESSGESRPTYAQENYYIEQDVTPGTYLGPLDATLPDADKVPLLFKPFTVKDLTIANRIVVTPMCMYSAKDGFFTNFHLAHLGSLAINGAGLIIVEATGVQANGRITPACTGLWDDAHVYKLKEIVDFVHAQGSKIGIQLAHAGRKASTKGDHEKGKYNVHSEDEHWADNVVGPSGGSDFQWDHTHRIPRELSLDEIQEIIDDFGSAAARATAAGVDMIEVHSAHGYLLHNFLSPITNHRTDKYGGSLENRARLLLEVVAKVRAIFPAEKPIFVRVSASDLVENVVDGPSWELQQTIQLAKWLHEAGVDVIDVSSGGNTAQQVIKPFPGYQVPFAEKIRQAVPGLTVMAVGLILTGKQGEQVLRTEKADLIAVGRPFLRHPNYVGNAARDLNVRVKFSMQYNSGSTFV